MKAASSCFDELGAAPDLVRSTIAHSPARFALTPLQALIALPVPLFAITLTAMLFRPPDADLPPVDRLAFLLLVFAVGARALILRQTAYLPKSVLAPMLGLNLLALASLLTDTYDVTTWGVLASRIFVPSAMFLLAQFTFDNDKSLRWLERFLLLVFAYLSFTAVASLLGAQALIFPRFILDESIGIHADRARGPFLQAVANGVSLNLLGVLAIDRFRRRRLCGPWAAVLLVSFPLAIIATKTRAVWVSFAVSVVWMSLRLHDRRLWRAAIVLTAVAGAGVLGALCLGHDEQGLADRLNDEGTVEFRMAAYQAGWDMFLQKPLTGWGTRAIQAELAERISEFHGESFAVHNTYVQALLEQGILGLLLYVWLMVGFYGLRDVEPDSHDDLTASIRGLWPVLLAIYLVNGIFVVMNYQFVNSLLFIFAGLLAVRRKSAARMI